MKDSIVKQVMAHLREQHLREVKKYFQLCRRMDYRYEQFKSNLYARMFYCVVQHPKKKYLINKHVQQEELNLYDNSPEFDSNNI